MNDLEKDVESLKKEIGEVKKTIFKYKVIVIACAAFLVGAFSLNTFWQIPQAITKAITDSAANKATASIKALKKEAEENLLPEIRKLKSEADAAKTNAEKSAEYASASAEEAAEKWKLHNSPILEKLKFLLPKPVQMSLTFKELEKVMTGWCGHIGAKTSWADVNGDGYADILCDDNKGQHWVQLSMGDGETFKDLGKLSKDWCNHEGSRTTWADVNGDNRADMICDDSDGMHWIQLSNPYD